MPFLLSMAGCLRSAVLLSNCSIGKELEIMTLKEAIAEIRAVRHRISEEYGHSTKALLDHYKELEKDYKDRIITKRSSTGTTHDEMRLHA